MAVFNATLSQLGLMLEFVQASLAKNGVSKNESTLFEVAVEEAIVNIIKHGYKHQGGKIELAFLVSLPDRAVLQIKDEAPPFNPMENPPPFNPRLTLEERPIGGGGLYLIGKIMDMLSYLRDGPHNVLTLEKSFKPAAIEENLHSPEYQ